MSLLALEVFFYHHLYWQAFSQFFSPKCSNLDARSGILSVSFYFLPVPLMQDNQLLVSAGIDNGLLYSG